jgi:hypothetical protein
MTSRARQLLLATAGLLAAHLPGAVPAHVAPAPSPVPLTRQIDALLKRRLRPEPLPLDLPNPFALPGPTRRDATFSSASEPVGVVTPPAPTNPDIEARVATNAEVLAECAARLKVGGIMRVQGRVQLVINDVPRKEGDTIIVPWGSNKISLTLVSILAEQVVVRYNDAELALRF